MKEKKLWNWQLVDEYPLKLLLLLFQKHGLTKMSGIKAGMMLHCFPTNMQWCDEIRLKLKETKMRKFSMPFASYGQALE